MAADTTPAPCRIILDSTTMKHLLLRLAMIASVISMSSAVHAACDYPTRVEVPDGMTADKETMLRTQSAVKEYVTAMEAYLECIVQEEKEARLELDDLDAEIEQQREDLLNKKYNAGVGEMETLAARFNEEVQRFRERDQ